MGGLRAMIEDDLAVTLEGDYGVAGQLVDPDGIKYSVVGRLIYDHAEVTAQGDTVIVHAPIYTLRRSTLARIPLLDEKWEVRVPVDPSSSTLSSFVLDPNRPPEDGRSIGYVKLYLFKPVQATV